jgi:hypothetical protein
MAGEFKEYPKMLYHDKRAPRTVNNKDEETAATGQGYKTQAPAQFPESDNPDTANMPDQSADPLREPQIVSQIDQEKTRIAGNQGAKDPATLNQPGENGDENSEDELSSLAGPKSGGKSKGK